MLAVAFVMCFAAGSVYAETVVPSKITEVVLFSNEALIARDATAKVQKGLNTVAIELKEYMVDKDSVQAKVMGYGEVYSVQLKDIQMRDMPQDAVSAAQKKIEDLENGRRELTDRAGVIGKKELFLSAIIDFAKVQVPHDIKTQFPSVENLDKALTFLDAQYAAVNKEKQALDLKIKELDKTIDAAKRELDDIAAPGLKKKQVIEILFNADKDQEITVEATYLAYYAGWQPQYKVNVSADLKQVSMVMFATITQKTGEDWNDVRVVLSNVIPLKGAELPGLQSWTVDIQRPAPPPAPRAAGGMFKMAMASRAPMMEEAAEMSADGMGGGIGGPPPEAEFTGAVAKELPLAFEYAFPQPLGMASQEKETLLPVFTKSITGNFFYYAVPKENSLTFLVCRAQSDKEVLSAPLNVYFAGRYVGKTFLSEKKPGQDFDLNLGADREVIVKRETIKDKLKETTFFGKVERGTIVRELQFKITVENLKSRQVTIKVLDNIPVSKTDKVEVRDVKLAPEPAQKDYLDQAGVMLWDLTLNPKEKKEITIEFTVAYPKDTPVTNL
jgi:uncharacterized protein (TIGR02231 family)